MEEIFKVHPIYTNYAGSNLGRIKNLKRNRMIKCTVHTQKGITYANCYFNVYKDGKRIGTRQAGRFIWECHNGIIPKGYEIDHLDTDTTNNKIENLRLVSHIDNCRNPLTIEHYKGRRHSQETKKKIAESNEKPIVQYTMDGKYVREWKSIKEAQKYFNPKTQNIVYTLKGYGGRKSAYGFIWRYK